MILEGCYPYVRGGVSTWVHNYILDMPQHEFVLWVIGAEAKNKGQYKYELPPNVVEIREVFLDDAMRMPVVKNPKLKFTPEEIEAHKQLMSGEDLDWSLLFQAYNRRKTNVHAFLMSEAFLDILLDICHRDFPFIAFSDLFHTIRSILLPTLYLISQDIPTADVYHSTCTGYAGLLGALASTMRHKPFIVTEHGIYSREREEEILRATWVEQHFKRLWIRHFYLLARAAYQTAVSVTALYSRANRIQQELGCPGFKQKVIFNGIETYRFAHVPPKPLNGHIDIGAIVRFHPIKDIKTMIYAFFELKTRVPGARLHILGDTDDEEYRTECEDLIEQLGVKDILIVGNTDTAAYMEKLDFTVLTSISEGQPLSVLESLAAGRPCVATDVGCCRELLTGETIDDFGQAGIVVKPMHAQAIATGMEVLSKHPLLRAEMGRIGQKRVLKNFRHEEIIAQYLENYREAFRRWQV